MQKNWTSGQVGRFKPAVFLLSLYPLCRWLWLGFNDGLGANPPEFLIRSTGVWALVLLTVTLAVTPVRRMLGQPALLRFRRMLGLFSFFYTVLHVLAWALWEQGWSAMSMWQDIVVRPFITIGTIAFVFMTALAVTSTRAAIRTMGRHWQSLHRSVYAIAALSVWHFWLVRAGKNDFFEPYAYAAAITVLLLIRVVFLLRKHSAGQGL